MPEEISLPTLRAELASLELRIVDRLTLALAVKADTIHVEQLESRVHTLEVWQATRLHTPDVLSDQEKRITKLERFRYAVPGVAVISAVIAVLMFAERYVT